MRDFIDKLNEYECRCRAQHNGFPYKSEVFTQLKEADEDDVVAISAIIHVLSYNIQNYARYAPIKLENNTMNGIETEKQTWRIHFMDKNENEFYIEAHNTKEDIKIRWLAWDDNRIDPELREVQPNSII